MFEGSLYYQASSAELTVNDDAVVVTGETEKTEETDNSDQVVMLDGQQVVDSKNTNTNTNEQEKYPGSEDDFDSDLDAFTEFISQKEEQLAELFFQLEANKDNQEKFDRLISLFNTIMVGVYKKFDSIKIESAILKLQENLSGQVLEKADNALTVLIRVEAIAKNKDMLVLRNSEFGELLEAKSSQEQVAVLEQLVVDGKITPEKADELKTRLTEIQEISGLFFDGFMSLNTNASWETFLAFLRNPVDVGGRSGSDSLNFGSETIDGVEAKVIPLPMFRDQFQNIAVVSKALVESARFINEEWFEENSEALNDLREKPSAQMSKELLLKMYKDLLTDSEKAEENKTKFRAYFTTALFEGSVDKDKLKFMSEEAFVFFQQQLDSDGEGLNILWQIEETTETEN